MKSYGLSYIAALPFQCHTVWIYFTLLGRRSAIFLAVCICIEAIWQNHGFHISDSGLVLHHTGTPKSIKVLPLENSRKCPEGKKNQNSGWNWLTAALLHVVRRVTRASLGCASYTSELLLGQSLLQHTPLHISAELPCLAGQRDLASPWQQLVAWSSLPLQAWTLF